VSGVVQRRLRDAMKERAPALARYDFVDERSRAIEKERYRAELDRTDEVLAAYDVFDDWWQATGFDAVNAQLATNHAAERRAVAKLLRRIRKLADPTAPGWKPPLSQRLATKAAGHDVSRGRGRP
jgi:hypothetical protein